VPLNSTRTPPIVVASLPDSRVRRRVCRGGRSNAVPKMVTISPGETGPPMKLAAFTTLLMGGSGAVAKAG